MSGVTAQGLARMQAARGRANTPDPVLVTPVSGLTGGRRGRSRATRLLALLGSCLALVLAASAPVWAQSRSERIGEVRISAELATDGSLRVVEEREFVYQGSFQGAFYELPLRDDQSVALNSLTDAEGTTYRPGQCSPDGTKQPGAYVVETSADRLTVTWCWNPPPTDTTRTIRLDYTVTNAGVRHEDSSELYWQFVGTGWAVPTDSVTADVQLPTDDIQFWAHGPLTGTVERVEPRTIRLAVQDLPPNTFVELRVLMPAAALSAAPNDGRRVREQILAQEQCLATAADADRARARGEEPAQDCDPAAGRKRLVTGALALGLLGGGLGWWHMFRRHGKEYPLPELPDYEHDLPSDHPPAFVDYLLNWGNLSDKALIATIMDLARRRHISLRRELVTQDRFFLPDREEAITVFERGSLPEREWERDVLRLLFDLAGGGSDTVTNLDIKDWVATHRNKAYDWWQSWKSAVAADTAGNRWIESNAWIGASAGLGLALTGAAVGGGFAGANLALAGATGLAGIGAMAASPLMRRRTEEGRILEQRWRRFGAYLQDYSLIPERGPEYLALWGQWLVYAVPLGVAETVVKNLNAKLSEAELQQVAGGWYPMLYVNGHVYGGFDSGLTSITAAIPTSAIATSPASSTGGGGGFSGGGGGGGGGSGGGSF
jgi:uncharacterized membrane protein YgcG